ncbi:hypothetical protein WA158_006712 [Blastocystis sp. Blastoise]
MQLDDTNAIVESLMDVFDENCLKNNKLQQLVFKMISVRMCCLFNNNKNCLPGDVERILDYSDLFTLLILLVLLPILLYQRHSCESSNTYRPIGCHHCSTCNKCILRMDHHCTWCANCIGYYNHRYFICFLFYGLLVYFISFSAILYCYRHINLSIYAHTIRYNLLFGFLFSLAAILVFTIYLIWQFSAILKGLTVYDLLNPNIQQQHAQEIFSFVASFIYTS